MNDPVTANGSLIQTDMKVKGLAEVDKAKTVFLKVLRVSKNGRFHSDILFRAYFFALGN